MISIALYGQDDNMLDELRLKLMMSLSSFGHEFLKIQKLTYFQTSLFEDEIDLYIVDLTTEPEKCMRFARDIKRPFTEIIFIAGDSRFAMEAFDLEALGYYTPPLNIGKITSRIVSRFSRPEIYDRNLLLFKTPSVLRVIPAVRITHIEYTNHKMKVFLDTGHIVTTTTMRKSFTEATEDVLRHKCFVRTHASFIANITHISSLTPHSIVLDNDTEVPIAHTRYSEVKQHILNYFKGLDGDLP